MKDGTYIVIENGFINEPYGCSIQDFIEKNKSYEVVKYCLECDIGESVLKYKLHLQNKEVLNRIGEIYKTGMTNFYK